MQIYLYVPKRYFALPPSYEKDEGWQIISFDSLFAFSIGVALRSKTIGRVQGWD